MTDLPPTDIDELLSAVLDGEATAAEVARVEGDPELVGRLERLRSLADLVGTAHEPPAGLADDAVTAALTHLTPSAEHPTSPRFDELSARRARRVRRFAPLLAAAAAVVVVAASVVAIQSLDSGESQDLATAGQALDDEDTGADARSGDLDETTDSGAAETAEPSASPAAPGADAENVSSFSITAPDLDGFEDQVRDLLAEVSVSTTIAAPSGDTPAPEQVDAALECPTTNLERLGSPILFGQGDLDGVPVTYEVVLTQGDMVLVITDGSCEVIAEIAL
ncbi:MAG TPA: hypothetical protein VMW08_06985 [Acidimicrobiales bacterium]|nr:hypothetical protein [Acidimicrobiales bacterium]